MPGRRAPEKARPRNAAWRHAAARPAFGDLGAAPVDAMLWFYFAPSPLPSHVRSSPRSRSTIQGRQPAAGRRRYGRRPRPLRARAVAGAGTGRGAGQPGVAEGAGRIVGRGGGAVSPCHRRDAGQRPYPAQFRHAVVGAEAFRRGGNRLPPRRRTGAGIGRRLVEPGRAAGLRQARGRGRALSPQRHRARCPLRQGALQPRLSAAAPGPLGGGWPLLETRWQFDSLVKHFVCPRWQGESLTGKAIAIGFEAGHGDMIQFCRYATRLKELGAARVAIVCHPGLKTLFGTLPGVDQVWGFDQPVPADGWDFWTLPMSLPKFFDTRVDHVYAPIPYLRADPQLVRHWPALLPRAGLRVGLAWKGNANFENDADRSLRSLQMLAPLGAVAGVQFVSLQKGAGEEEAAQPPDGMRLVDAAYALRDFADTAALIANLDLVISVDTAVAHLAGVLGVPCWLLLPDNRTDWRWLTERADTPWYPQMRLFRQRAGGSGDWHGVIADVAAALAVLVATVADQ